MTARTLNIVKNKDNTIKENINQIDKLINKVATHYTLRIPEFNLHVHIIFF